MGLRFYCQIELATEKIHPPPQRIFSLKEEREKVAESFEKLLQIIFKRREVITQVNFVKYLGIVFYQWLSKDSFLHPLKASEDTTVYPIFSGSKEI